MVSIRFNFVYEDQCPHIDNMFTNTDDYKYWANID